MKKRIVWIALPVAALLCVGLALALTLTPKVEFAWVDPPPPDNSLAQEAQRKLAGPPTEKVDKSASHRSAHKSNAKAPSFNGPYIVIDTHTNRLYWRTTDSVLYSALCSTGTGGELVDTADGRRWRFNTPRGVFAVDSRVTDPWWRKPDWAFIEEGEPVPPKNSEERLDNEVMGDYAIGFGNGYFIHGTLYERLIGVAATHGCVRLSAGDLAYLYPKVHVGTPVVIF
ncbi:MAG: L,D-transpeptidase [candidate division Zixibacteria bacterium]|nr:L,D-transpeptidase [candidate division Zixibacteria bacterium]